MRSEEMEVEGQQGRRFVAIAGVIVVSAAVAALFSAVVMRTPSTWWIIPDWLTDAVLSTVTPATQDDVATAEALAAWLLFFVPLAVLATSLLLIRQRRRHLSRGTVERPRSPPTESR